MPPSLEQTLADSIRWMVQAGHLSARHAGDLTSPRPTTQPRRFSVASHLHRRTPRSRPLRNCELASEAAGMSPYPCPRRSAIDWSDDWHDARKSCWFSRHWSTPSCRNVEDRLTRPPVSKTSGATTASACCFAERDGVAWRANLAGPARQRMQDSPSAPVARPAGRQQRGRRRRHAVRRRDRAAPSSAFSRSRARGAGLRRPDPETRKVREQGSARLAAEPCFARSAGPLGRGPRASTLPRPPGSRGWRRGGVRWLPPITVSPLDPITRIPHRGSV